MPQKHVNTKYRKRKVKEWVEHYGRVCAGWETLPHPVGELTPLHWDHIIPLSKGGSEYGPGQVLCKHCNEAKHNSDPRDFKSLKTATPKENPLSSLMI